MRNLMSMWCNQWFVKSLVEQNELVQAGDVHANSYIVPVKLQFAECNMSFEMETTQSH